MSGKIANQPSSPLADPAEVRQALDKLLSSRHFVNAHKKKAFLRLICDLYLEGRADEVNEYRLGFDVFGRDPGYSPSADPIVRVVAHEIRKKLELYYQSEGASDPVRLELPAGSYQPLFTRQGVVVEPEPEPIAEPIPVAPVPDEPLSSLEPAPAPSRRISPATIGLSAAVLVLLVLVAVLAQAKRDLERSVAPALSSEASAMAGPLWAPFVRDRTPPLVILSNPPVLRVSNASDPLSTTREAIPLGSESVAAMRDKVITNPEVLVREGSGKGSGAPSPSPVVRQSNEPRLVYSTNVYTGLGEAIGLHRLTDYFRTAGRELVLKQSRTLSAEDLKNHNLILLGGAWVNEWSGKGREAEPFVFTNRGTIEDRAAGEAETKEYIPEFEGATGGLVVDYALITVTANLTTANTQMVLAGIYSPGTEAAAEFVTDRTYVDQLNAKLDGLGASEPLYFQALLKVGVENGIPTTISVVALRRVPAP